ncbi:MAG: DUF362 domain-containing protein [Spirochaetales bacterium]|nr:DUF362 domain-containing protein [Spirochaetales bacterium]
MKKSDVYFIGLSGKSSMAERLEATKKILQASSFDSILKKKDTIAVKLHVGEKGNDTYVKADIIKVIVSRIKRSGALPFLTETSTLYKGSRSNAVDHINLAYSHGFTPQAVGASFIMADGLIGDSETDVEIPGRIFNKVSIAREIVTTDALVAVSHVKGHMVSGMGAAIKTLGMGLSSRKGKLRQHSSMKPAINQDKCTFCRKCIQFCPEDVIVEKGNGKKYAFILTEKCIGCGECLAVCRYDAVTYNWGVGSMDLQKRMVEHALGVLMNKREKCFFLNYLIDMTKDCDCLNAKQDIIAPDVGIVASTDPVACDQASLDLTARADGKNISRKAYPSLDPRIQLKYGHELGLGSTDYNLITV